MTAAVSSPEAVECQYWSPPISADPGNYPPTLHRFHRFHKFLDLIIGTCTNQCRILYQDKLYSLALWNLGAVRCWTILLYRQIPLLDGMEPPEPGVLKVKSKCPDPISYNTPLGIRTR